MYVCIEISRALKNADHVPQGTKEMEKLARSKEFAMLIMEVAVF